MKDTIALPFSSQRKGEFARDPPLFTQDKSRKIHLGLYPNQYPDFR